MPLLPEELYDVFYVTQLTRGTALERMVAVDRVRVQAGRYSQIHRHLEAETVLFIEKGSGVVTINGECHEVSLGSRVCIPAGAWHGVGTFDSELVFISIQSPPIHDEATGRHDLEPLKS
ncbi:MAG: cupin domain-containing protein [bacterium]|nr:cupin domain-containing protein [bacterium]MDZ4285634.1 cupin domain-containing protein [Candidatus Sungbacteria bacterium]